VKILYNAKFYTLDPDQPVASAIAISDGKIVAVGSLDGLTDISPRKVEKVDLGGRFVLPGLVDSHIHLSNYAYFLKRVDCETATIAECLKRVAERAKIMPAGQWVMGHGWNQNLWTNGFGFASDLDRLAPDNPVYLTAKSLHAGWANSIALKLAGITSNTPDPAGGQILRGEHGQPTGILLESAMRLVEKVIPVSTAADNREAVLGAQTALWKMGLTGVHDFDGVDSFETLQNLDLAGELRLRVVKSIPRDFLEQAIALRLHTGFGSEFLKIGAVKCFADGALGPKTGAMLQPYEGDPANRGLLLMDHEEVLEVGQKAVSGGLSLAVHAIGDRANHEVILGMVDIRKFEKEAGIRPLPHRIEHVQVLHPDDFSMLSKNRIIASMQPIHATSDMKISDQHIGKRSAGAYAWNTLLKANTTLIFGSDAPVESPNPFLGLHAAVTRSLPDGSPGPEGWYPEQRLSLQQAVQGYTHGKSFKPGQPADLITLSDDPYSISPSDLWQMKPSATMVAGEWVWQEA
jgi:predicted amidohydrolase YtcJ